MEIELKRGMHMKNQKKIIFPKIIKVSGVDYKILYPYKLDLKITENSCLGLHSGPSDTIRITDEYDGRRLPNPTIVETFIHEILHAIDHIYCNSKINTYDYDSLNFEYEIIIPELAAAWLYVLKNNNIFSVKGIPKSIDIYGYKFNVIFPYDGDVEDINVNSGAVNHDLLEIYIRANRLDGSEKFSMSYIKRFLVYFINCCIINKFIKAHKERIEDLLIFSNGLYQVIIDNNLEDLVKKYK